MNRKVFLLAALLAASIGTVPAEAHANVVSATNRITIVSPKKSSLETVKFRPSLNIYVNEPDFLGSKNDLVYWNFTSSPFNFDIEAVTPYAPMPEQDITTEGCGDNKGFGYALFGEMEFEVGVPYTYKLTLKKGDDPHINYDHEPMELTILANDKNGDGSVYTVEYIVDGEKTSTLDFFVQYQDEDEEEVGTGGAITPDEGSDTVENDAGSTSQPPKKPSTNKDTTDESDNTELVDDAQDTDKSDDATTPDKETDGTESEGNGDTNAEADKDEEETSDGATDDEVNRVGETGSTSESTDTENGSSSNGGATIQAPNTSNGSGAGTGSSSGSSTQSQGLGDGGTTGSTSTSKTPEQMPQTGSMALALPFTLAGAGALTALVAKQLKSRDKD